MVSRLKIIGPFGSDLRNKTYRPRKLNWMVGGSNIGHNSPGRCPNRIYCLFCMSPEQIQKKGKTETKRNSTDFWSLLQQNAVAMESTAHFFWGCAIFRNDLVPLTAQIRGETQHFWGINPHGAAKWHALALHPFAAIESVGARSCKPGQRRFWRVAALVFFWLISSGNHLFGGD